LKLRLLRDAATDMIAIAGPKELPALSRELRAVLLEIDAIDTAPEVSELDRIVADVADELAPRRRAIAPTGT
jgi:hypothetical protein